MTGLGDLIDARSIAYRTGVIDRHFNRPKRSEDPAYLQGYDDPDPYMPPQYKHPDVTPWPLRELTLKRKGQR